MTRIPASGAMTWNDIQNSFGGSNPIFINEYYNSGSLVSPSDLNTDIPTSGQIEAADFRGADGFSGTTCTFAIGTSGGKLVQNGYASSGIGGLSAFGSNLGTAFTTGSGVKLNFFKLTTFGGNLEISSTTSVISNATITKANLEGKLMTFTGKITTTKNIPAPTNGDAGTNSIAPTSFGGQGFSVTPPEAINYGFIGQGNGQSSIDFGTSGTQNISIA